MVRVCLKGAVPMKARKFMKACVPVLFFSLLIFFWVGPSAPARDKTGGDARCEKEREEIRRLTGLVRELEEANALFMENLAECAEENETLIKRLEGSVKREEARQARRDALVLRIRTALKTEQGLDFLKTLREDHLRILLDSIVRGVR